jgi:hypothetical protein
MCHGSRVQTSQNNQRDLIFGAIVRISVGNKIIVLT